MSTYLEYICNMHKVLIITSLIIIYFTLLFLPNLPFVEYYYVQSKLQNEDQSITNKESDVLIGDICYLNALIERSKNAKDAAKNKTLPEPNNSNINLVYLVTDIINFIDTNSSKNIRFLNHVEFLTYRYLQIPSPPPKFS